MILGYMMIKITYPDGITSQTVTMIDKVPIGIAKEGGSGNLGPGWNDGGWICGGKINVIKIAILVADGIVGKSHEDVVRIIERCGIIIPGYLMIEINNIPQWDKFTNNYINEKISYWYSGREMIMQPGSPMDGSMMDMSMKDKCHTNCYPDHRWDCQEESGGYNKYYQNFLNNDSLIPDDQNNIPGWDEFTNSYSNGQISYRHSGRVMIMQPRSPMDGLEMDMPIKDKFHLIS